MAARSTRQRLGMAIRARRELLGLTQEEAAEGAELSTRYWRSLEAGQPAVALEVIERVIESLDWSWSGLGEALSPEVAGRGAPGGSHRLLDDAWRQATPREREIVHGTLRVIATGKRGRTPR